MKNTGANLLMKGTSRVSVQTGGILSLSYTNDNSNMLNAYWT